jgi:HAD superfamily hydrolase (TIGR01509 family)
MKVILFDFFGVICSPTYFPIIQKYLPPAQQQQWFDKIDLLDRGDLSEDDLLRQLSEHVHIPTQTLFGEANAGSKLNQPLIAAATSLKPTYRIGLFTNIARNMLERLLGAQTSHFDIQIVSSDLGLIKPDPKIFEAAIARCNCPAADILFVDDSPNNIRVAKDLGMNGIVYKDMPALQKEIKKYL